MASRSDAPPGSPVRAADAPGPGDPPGSVASEEETPASDATEASPEAPARASADAALASSRGMAFAYNRHHVPPVPPDPPAVSRAGPTPLIDPSAVPEVLRAVALEDGCVKVNFRDNTVLALDPTGAAFTAHAPDGESVRQLADFAVTRFANKLRLALEFRNAHVDVPYYPPAVMLRGRRSSSSRTTENPTSASGDAAPRVFRCSRRVSVARWSRDATSAAREGLLTRLASGAVALESADGVARVVLSAHGLVATVTYPLLFERKDDWTRAAAPEETDAEENEAGSRPTAFDYVWHTQTFAADACPSRWAFPVALLTAAAYTNGSEEEEEDASDANEATTPPKRRLAVFRRRLRVLSTPPGRGLRDGAPALRLRGPPRGAAEGAAVGGRGRRRGGGVVALAVPRGFPPRSPSPFGTTRDGLRFRGPHTVSSPRGPAAAVRARPRADELDRPRRAVEERRPLGRPRSYDRRVREVPAGREYPGRK